MTARNVARAPRPSQAAAPSSPSEQYRSWAVNRILTAMHQSGALDGIDVSTVDPATAAQWPVDAEVAITALGRFVERLPRLRRA